MWFGPQLKASAIQLTEKWQDMILVAERTSTLDLKLLKSGQILPSNVVKKMIEIVQARHDESSVSVSTIIKVYEPVDPIDIRNLPAY